MANKKHELVEFLDRKVFDPVLNESETGRSDQEKAKLRHVKESTRTEKQRYHKYEDAAKVKQMFHDDLSSEPAKRIHRESRDLGLPTLPEVEEEFNSLCQRLGV